jgi:hypothetical protein
LQEAAVVMCVGKPGHARYASVVQEHRQRTIATAAVARNM